MNLETAVLISIRPQWCELIANGQKTLEVRKNRPKLEPPFTCYIYCTQGRYEDIISTHCGYVIGEFVCDGISYYRPKADFNKDRMIFPLRTRSCLTANDVWEYSGNGKKPLYGWRISELTVYKKPLKLSDFLNLNGEPIRRAPQSWQYVQRRK